MCEIYIKKAFYRKMSAGTQMCILAAHRWSRRGLGGPPTLGWQGLQLPMRRWQQISKKWAPRTHDNTPTEVESGSCSAPYHHFGRRLRLQKPNKTESKPRRQSLKDNRLLWVLESFFFPLCVREVVSNFLDLIGGEILFLCHLKDWIQTN